MVAFTVNKGVPFADVMAMDCVAFCSLHDNLLRNQLAEIAQTTRLTQLAAQGSSKQLDKALAPFDDASGVSDSRKEDDLGRLGKDVANMKGRK